MKTSIVLKEFSALSIDAGRIGTTSPPSDSGSQPLRMSDTVRLFAVRQTKRAEKFREMLRRRESAPFASAIPYHRYGINE